MELNNLQFDCLSCIFDYFSDLKQLLELAKVCTKWNNLVRIRLNKIRHFHFVEKIQEHPNSSDNHIYTDDIELVEKINASHLFPNLKFFTKETMIEQCTCKAVANVLATSKPLIGLNLITVCQIDIDPSDINYICHIDIDDIVKYCGQLEYLVTEFKPFIRSYSTKFKFGETLKHFGTSISFEEFPINLFREIYFFSRLLHEAPNLEELILRDYSEVDPVSWRLPKMEKLKVFELSLQYEKTTGLKFLPFFPNLTSVYLDISEDDSKPFIGAKIHENVEDLVLDIYGTEGTVANVPMEFIVKTLMLFPNCTNFMIIFSGSFAIKNEQLIEMLKILPKCSFFVVQASEWGDASTIEVIDNYCESVECDITFFLYRCKSDTGFMSVLRSTKFSDDVYDTDNQFVRTYFLRD